MGLPPEGYEDAWKHDESVRATAEAIFEEWQGNIEQAETAWELTRLIESKRDPNRALSIILGIMALDIRDEQIAHLGAGPLEDLLSYSGPECIDVIGRLADRNPRFKRVLGHVWQTAEMDPIVWRYIENVLGQASK